MHSPSPRDGTYKCHRPRARVNRHHSGRLGLLHEDSRTPTRLVRAHSLWIIVYCIVESGSIHSFIVNIATTVGSAPSLTLIQSQVLEREFQPGRAHHFPRYKANPSRMSSMPPSPSVSSPQSPPPPIETAHDHSFVAAEPPEQAQSGTPSGPAALREQQRSATLESLLDELDRHMTENISNDSRSPTRRAPNSPVRVRHTIPDPVAAAPNAPRATTVPPSPTSNNHQRLSIAGRILVFFGYGRNNRARKELVSLIISLVVDASQVRHILGCPTMGHRA